MGPLSTKEFDGRKVFYRTPTTEKGRQEGTSDEHALREVLTEHCYSNHSIGFDVKEDEIWLDLGANIGAFAVYCDMKGAVADCYEPDRECFDVLMKNVSQDRCKFCLFNTAVTASTDTELQFFSSSNPDNRYRGTIHEVIGYQPQEKVRNMYAGVLLDGIDFDGIKMDIEGSEFGIIDNWLLPKCNKLVLEYHTSRDPSVDNLRRRVEVLKEHFENVLLTAAHELLLASDLEVSDLNMDQIIFCWGAK